jgi:hypothetical protein
MTQTMSALIKTAKIAPSTGDSVLCPEPSNVEMAAVEDVSSDVTNVFTVLVEV